MLKPDQIIMPLREFPLAGFTVSTDEGYADGSGWQRTFGAPLSTYLAAPFKYVDLRVEVINSFMSPALYFGLNKCESNSKATPTSSNELSGPASGDASLACRFQFASGQRFDYYVLHRNLNITVSLLADNATNEGAAIDEAVALARQQIVIIDRVAPK